MGQECKLLGVSRVRTTPYYPETNGSVERMHDTFKSILGKCMDKGHDWVSQVPFVLFVLRQIPLSDSGFSPFDLVFGFHLHTPLDALYYGIHDANYKNLNVSGPKPCKG